jgi:carbon-monoxide dehydrogenase medium subunit
MPAVMLVLDAQMVLRSKRGERVVPASNFFEGMYTTALRADEMLTEVRVPVGQSKSGFGFEEISVRQGDYAIALVASAVAVANGKISAASLAFAGVSDKALRFPALEKKLIGQVPTETLFSEVSEEAIKMIFTDTENSDDRVYRQDLIRSLTPRALKQAVAAAAN